MIKITNQEYSPNTVTNSELDEKNNRRNNRTMTHVPYSGKQGNKLLTSIKKELKKILPNNVKTIVTYQNKKIRPSLMLDIEPNNKLIYCNKYPYDDCSDRSCCSQMFYKIDVLKNFGKLTRKHL